METINYQPPAEGILLQTNRPDYKVYKIACECMTDKHAITMSVSVDDSCISVEHSMTVYTPFFREYIRQRYDIKNDILSELRWFSVNLVNSLMNRLSMTWRIWTQSHIEMEAGTIMTAQQALNYSKTLAGAIKDLEDHRQANARSGQ